MTDNKLADALHILLMACDDSDSAMYGTLGVSFVRDVAQAALADHDSTSAAPDAPAPVQVDVLGELADEIEDTYPNADASNLRAFAADAQPPAPEPVQPPANGEADEFDKPAMELTALRKKLAAAEDAAKSAGEAESIMLFEIERMYQESRATLIRAAIAELQQKVTTPALPEVTDEDVAAAWDVLLITGQPIDSCACDGDMRKVLESYRASLMAKAVPNG